MKLQRFAAAALTATLAVALCAPAARAEGETNQAVSFFFLLF